MALSGGLLTIKLILAGMKQTSERDYDALAEP